MGVDAIITDVPKVWLDLREQLQKDYINEDKKHSRMFMWSSYKFWSVYQYTLYRHMERVLIDAGGSFDSPPAIKVA
jgi:phosphatidylglycerol phospholipase C